MISQSCRTNIYLRNTSVVGIEFLNFFPRKIGYKTRDGTMSDNVCRADYILKELNHSNARMKLGLVR